MNSKKKRIFITEEQLNRLTASDDRNNKPYIVDPQFNLYAKGIMDKLFVRASENVKNENGYPSIRKIFGLKACDGSVLNNLDFTSAFDMMMDKLKEKYDDTQRKAYVRLILKKWYNNEIDKDGGIGIYYYNL